ncbi:MAG TPA: D-hexose-6-phosphate mutarotase [Longimicrobium sp.]
MEQDREAAGRAIVLTSPAGGRAEVMAHGAHVVRWTDPASGEVLYLSPRSRFGPGASIRGGIPVIFPQFADQGPLPKHGFARTAEWEVAERGSRYAVLRLADSAETRAVWDHAFECRLRVELGDALAVTLAVRNMGEAAFDFTCALHTYLRVGDIRSVWIDGLKGIRYRDKVAGGEHVQRDARLRFAGETDRVYLDAPDELRLVDGGAWDSVLLRKHGFDDTVVWNPWAEKARGMDDLGEDQFPRFVCVEAACAGRPVRLEPGGRWKGSQEITAER